MYGCELWVILNIIKRKIQALEIKYLRKGKGVIMLDGIKTKQVLKLIEKRRLNRWGNTNYLFLHASAIN